MEITLKLGEQEYTVAKDIENPDTDNVMYAVECLVKKANLDSSLVDQYILAWAEEIKNRV